MPFTLIKNGCQYTITLKRVPYANVKKHVEPHQKYVKFLSKKEGDIITKDQKDESLDILNDFKIHSSHATLHVSQLNLQKHGYNFAITSSYNKTIIKRSVGRGNS